jgi:hypothetical protein
MNNPGVWIFGSTVSSYPPTTRRWRLEALPQSSKIAAAAARLTKIPNEASVPRDSNKDSVPGPASISVATSSRVRAA